MALTEWPKWIQVILKVSMMWNSTMVRCMWYGIPIPYNHTDLEKLSLISLQVLWRLKVGNPIHISGHMKRCTVITALQKENKKHSISLSLPSPIHQSPHLKKVLREDSTWWDPSALILKFVISLEPWKHKTSSRTPEARPQQGSSSSSNEISYASTIGYRIFRLK